MASLSSTSSGNYGYSSPCAACKFLRRKCLSGCIFAPHFPPEDPQKFGIVHKIFGASNVSKLLNDLLPHQRQDAVASLAYEAEARIRDPVYGCVSAISFLQRQVESLQKEVDAANAELIMIRRYASNDMYSWSMPHHPMSPTRHDRRVCYQTASSFSSFSLPADLPWNIDNGSYNPFGGGNGAGTGDGV